MKAVLSSAAERDVKRALDYYLREAGADVADDFIDRLESKLARIRRIPSGIELSLKVFGASNLTDFLTVSFTELWTKLLSE